MNKTISLIIIFLIGLTACKNKEQEIDKVAMAKEYYEVLNTSDYSKIPTLMLDSITIKELDYSMSYSQTAFIEFLKWDAVFEPEYKILNMEEENGNVKATISKQDKRILFLLEGPSVTNELISFKNDKIATVAITDYVSFDDSVFSKNRTKFLNWMKEHHPEINGFLQDQSEQGGKKYLKAIELYKAANN